MCTVRREVLNSKPLPPLPASIYLLASGREGSRAGKVLGEGGRRGGIQARRREVRDEREMAGDLRGKGKGRVMEKEMEVGWRKRKKKGGTRGKGQGDGRRNGWKVQDEE